MKVYAVACEGSMRWLPELPRQLRNLQALVLNAKRLSLSNTCVTRQRGARQAEHGQEILQCGRQRSSLAVAAIELPATGQGLAYARGRSHSLAL